MQAFARFHLIDTQKKPRRDGAGAFDIRIGRSGSIAVIYQAPAGSPRRGHQPPDIAAAVTIAAAVIGRAADDDAGTAPAAMPTMMPAAMPTAPGGGGGRRQCGYAQR